MPALRLRGRSAGLTPGPPRLRSAARQELTMPEADVTKPAKEKSYYPNIPMMNPGFALKGAGALDWGMKNRLARIFNPGSGRTVMLAIDHGYFQGPTTGLERVDLQIVPLMPLADALMLTRGILRA